MWLSSVLVSSQIMEHLQYFACFWSRLWYLYPKKITSRGFWFQMFCFAFLSWKQVSTETWELDLASLVIIRLHNPVLLCLVMMVSCFSPVLPVRQMEKHTVVVLVFFIFILSSFMSMAQEGSCWAQSKHLCNRSSWRGTTHIYSPQIGSSQQTKL